MADPMWLLVMFDLPVKTKRQRHDANQYRHILLDQGFDMVQLSVYCKYYLSSNSVRKDITILKSNVPAGGSVRVMKVTDQQWASTLRFAGPKEVEVEAPPEQLMIF